MSHPMNDQQWAEWLAAERARLQELRKVCCGMCMDPEECEATRAETLAKRKPVYCPECGLQCGYNELMESGCCAACFNRGLDDPFYGQM